MDTANASISRISRLDLAARLGRADAPVLLDVRREATFAESPRMLAGAIRCAPEHIAAFTQSQPPREVVVYCVYGHNVSEDAVAELRDAGWNASMLAGGIEAARLRAVAYDIPGAPVSHEGEWCSFDGLLRAFEIEDPAVDRLARIVRGADTDRLALEPQCAGLLAFSLGLSHLHADDHAILEAAMPLYNALYAWCTSEAKAVWQGQQPEAHDWKPETMTGAGA
jgi:hypothetical protein